MSGEDFFARVFLERKGKAGRAGCTVVRREFDLNVEPLAEAAIGLQCESSFDRLGRSPFSHLPAETCFEVGGAQDQRQPTSKAAQHIQIGDQTNTARFLAQGDGN